MKSMSCLKTLTIYEEKSRPIMLHVKGIGDPLYSMMFLMAEGNKTMWQDLSRRLYHSALFSLGEIEGLSLGCTLEVNGWVFIPAVYVGL